ncbi:MAG: ABC transporter permease subunit [Clostridiaceae bacterium]|nr:ABC transporter permease subunit [Clostridiaceae bacterium]
MQSTVADELSTSQTDNLENLPQKKTVQLRKAPKKAGLARQYWKNRYLVLLLLPALIYFLIFCYGPMYGVQIAFKNFIFRLGIIGSPWVGLDNFRLLFSIKSFGEVFRNTLVISIYKLITGFPAPIIFAILLNEIRQVKFKKTVQTISYLPHFVSWVVLGGLFIQFLSPSTGPINVLLKAMGIEPIYFLADTKWFRSVLVVTSMWKGFGWGSIVYLASITSISPQLYEAAEIDGASRLRKIVSITLPELTPVITIMLIFSIGGIVGDDFDQIFNLYNAAVYSVGDVLGTYIYRVGLIDMKYSFSTAVGLFRNVISFALVLFANMAAKRFNEYGIW